MRRITTANPGGRDPDEKKKSRESVIANVVIFGAIVAVIRVCEYEIMHQTIISVHFCHVLLV